MLDEAVLPKVEPKDVNILIALPCYGSQVFVSHARSMRSLIDIFKQYGIRHQIVEVTSESLIPRGRNVFANIVVFDKDPAGNDYTHLLFLDVDIGFNAANILQAIGWNKTSWPSLIPARQSIGITS